MLSLFKIPIQVLFLLVSPGRGEKDYLVDAPVQDDNFTLLSSANQEIHSEEALVDPRQDGQHVQSSNRQVVEDDDSIIDEHITPPIISATKEPIMLEENPEKEALEEDDAGNMMGRLIKHLIEHDYDRRLRPHFHGKPIFVATSIYISAISAISELNSDFTIDFYMRQFWDDYRLMWNATDKEDVNIAGGFNEVIWQPDTYFPNAKTGNFQFVTRTNAFVRVSPHGHVRLSIRLTVTAYCHMKLSYFPFDHQKCSLIMQSYSLPVADLLFGWSRAIGKDGKRSPFVISRNAIAFESNVSSRANLRVTGFRLSEAFTLNHEDRNHSRLILEIYFARNIGYYFIQTYLPATLMVVSSWISFWLPRHSEPARVTLGVTTILALITLKQDYETLPKLSYLKAIDLFMLTSLGFCLIEFIVLALTLQSKTYKRQRNGQLLASTNLSADKCSGPWFGSLHSENVQQLKERTRTKCNTIARVVFPMAFFVFNVVYWNHFLLTHHSDADVTDAGFIPVH